MNKRIFGFILLILLWLYPAVIGVGYDITTLVSNLSFIIGVAALLAVKKKAVRNVILIVASAVGIIADYTYAFIAVPAILLLCSYQIITDNSSNNKSIQKQGEFFISVSSIFVVVQIAYIILGFDEQLNTIEPSSNSFIEILTILAAYIIILLLTYNKNIVERFSLNVRSVKQIRSIILQAFIFAALTGYIYMLREGFHYSPFQRGSMLYWFVMLIHIIYSSEQLFIKVKEEKKR